MSAAKLRFQVDSRLATLLSQEYKSTERALKELVDNAWDADADQVSIQLPKPLSGEPIVIRDDGTGMTEEELRRHYLTIAKDRRSVRGDRTAGKNRQVKGRKGIGKFAGFMAASVMTLETRTRGKLCRIALRLDAISNVEDIEHLDIALHSEDCDPNDHGTVITLSELHQGLIYPDANRLRQLLLQDYGRHDDFAVIVDEKRLDVDDVQGSYSEHQTTLPDVGDVKLRLSIFDGKAGLRQPGVTLRVGGKAVGSPSFFGLEGHEYFPPKLLKKMYGEVDADGLLDHVTAGWDSLVENSEKLKAVEAFVQPILISAAKEKYGMELQLAQARITGVPGPSTLTCLGAGGVVPLAQIVPVTRAVATAVLYQRGATGMATGQGSRSGHRKLSEKQSRTAWLVRRAARSWRCRNQLAPGE